MPCMRTDVMNGGRSYVAGSACAVRRSAGALAWTNGNAR